MWNLTSYDINRIKGQLQARKARIDARYAEDTKALDADFADLETLERVAAGLALKYKADEPADAAEESSDTTAEESLEARGTAHGSCRRGKRPRRKVRLALAPGSA